jgi:AraC-like DNA-binding protein
MANLRASAANADAVSATNLGLFRFSSNTLPPAERVPFYRDFVGRVLARIDLEPIGEQFFCDGRLRRLPDLTITRICGSAVRALRTREMAEGNDTFALIVNSQGAATFSQLGREAAVPAGNAVLVSDAHASLMQRTASRSLSIHVPQAILGPLLANPDAALLSPIPRRLEALQLLVGYVDLLLQESAPLGAAELRQLAVDHVYDLIAATVGATRDAAETAAGRGVRAARLRAIKTDIARNLGIAEVSAAALAARHGVSPRYIRKLFEGESTSLSRFVRDQRLARIHRQLTDPRHAQRTISELAFAVGFGDLATFNRDFRRRYAMTPSDVRRSRN